jgi:hypothetical protein
VYQHACKAPGCDIEFESKREDAKFCSPRCRQRNRRATGSTPKAKDAPTTTAAAPAANLTTLPARRGVYAVTLAELQRLERDATPLGQNALLLAERLDGSRHETGSSLAALERSFRSALEAATAGAETEGDALDGFRDRAFQVIAGGRV